MVSRGLSTRARVIRADVHSVTTSTTEVYPELHRSSQTISPKFVLRIYSDTPDCPQAVQGLETNSVYLLNISKKQRERETER